MSHPEARLPSKKKKEQLRQSDRLSKRSKRTVFQHRIFIFFLCHNMHLHDALSGLTKQWSDWFISCWFFMSSCNQIHLSKQQNFENCFGVPSPLFFCEYLWDQAPTVTGSHLGPRGRASGFSLAVGQGSEISPPWPSLTALVDLILFNSKKVRTRWSNDDEVWNCLKSLPF